MSSNQVTSFSAYLAYTCDVQSTVVRHTLTLEYICGKSTDRWTDSKLLLSSNRDSDVSDSGEDDSSMSAPSCLTSTSSADSNFDSDSCRVSCNICTYRLLRYSGIVNHAGREAMDIKLRRCASGYLTHVRVLSRWVHLVAGHT